MNLKSNTIYDNPYLSDTSETTLVLNNKEKKKVKHHYRNINKMSMKDNDNHLQEIIAKDISSDEEDNLDIPMLELTTEKNNIDSENANILNINNDNEEIEILELKRDFSFRNSKLLNASTSHINNKIEGFQSNFTVKSVNTIINSPSTSRIFIEDSKSKNLLSGLNFDNVKKAPANDYDNLFSACRRGDLGAVMYFIENCKLNNVSKTILTEKEVINKCEPESMIYINGEKKYVEGYTVLQNAIFGENLDVIKYLLSRPSIDINQKSGDKPSRSNGTTALHTASIHGHVNILSLLLQCGADPTILDCDGLDVVGLAIKNGNISIVQYLETQLTVHYQNSNYIYLSVMDGYIVMLNFLLKRGCPTSYIDPNSGKTALHLASERGFYEICKLLVYQDRGLIYQKDFNGKTPLDLAKTNSQKKNDFRKDYWNNIVTFLSKVEKNNIKDVNTLWHITIKRYLFLFFAPLFNMGLWFLITFSLPYIGIIISTVVCFLIHNNISQNFIANMNTSNPYIMMYSFVGIAYNLFMTSILIIPYSEEDTILNIFNVFIMVTVLILFLYCVNSDPGYLTKEYSMENAEYKNLSSLVFNGGEIKKYCYTCELMKPKKSKVKHCKLCNRCVCRFDHHCSFINNCVGAANHKAFIYLLVFSLTSLGMILFRMVQTIIKFYQNNGFIDYSIRLYYKLFSKNWIFYSSTVFLVLLDLAIFILLSLLSYQQFNQIAKGITYNDLIKSAREKLIKGENIDGEDVDEDDDEEEEEEEEGEGEGEGGEHNNHSYSHSHSQSRSHSHISLHHIIRKSSIDLRNTNNAFFDSTNDFMKFKYSHEGSFKSNTSSLKSKKMVVFLNHIKLCTVDRLSKYKFVRATINIAKFMFKRNIFDDLYKIKKNDISSEV
ncbi:hypothetical protein LY90DRAFT_375575 [Neocallimastix californiae]|uniref:Palmitoyltransferase n=1 Tax=Neocallimastix californiae TaxID=1754190 RepID=A0A1Y2FG19_9FUNG|nr:hypothetical protein LY90DRAFT_375575 [Neocallimastix californiae]|eukprot:ORY82862.1 hypothetical protein LY90DRAFT_375575 [Neocallimastix californiae]